MLSMDKRHSRVVVAMVVYISLFLDNMLLTVIGKWCLKLLKRKPPL